MPLAADIIFVDFKTGTILKFTNNHAIMMKEKK